MINLVLTGFLFVDILTASNEGEFVAATQRLESLRKLTLTECIEVCSYDSLYGDLEEDGLYPLLDRLDDAIRKFNIDVYDAPMIFNLITNLLTTSKSIEDLFDLEDVDIDVDDTVACRLNEKYFLNESVTRGFRHSLQICGMSGELSEDKAINLFICSSESVSWPIEIDGQVGLVVRGGEVLPVNKPCQWRYIGWDALTPLDDEDCASVIYEAKGQLSKLACVINLYIYSLNNSSEFASVSTGISIGKEFIGSLQKVVLMRDRNSIIPIVRAIKETQAQVSLEKTHWLRTGKGGGNPQRERKLDTARGWRRDIDRKTHLHYWQMNGLMVELAWVSYPHDDFYIPD
ncbi:MAG: hypothetical protein EOP06_04545 [Proteobacteria bacterium]|nr:MAG: hypothetical protein EOP06_04545 [Pseudomonadota bacterium]